jgi:NagD protein
MNKKKIIEEIRKKRGFICDMDGVLYHGERLLPGAREFVEWLIKEKKQFLFLTNASERTPRELQEKMKRMGIEVDRSHFYTSALATAAFLQSQKPGGSAFIIGEAGLINALYNVGYSMNSVDPDYVVMGETSSYSYEKIVAGCQTGNKGSETGWNQPGCFGSFQRGNCSCYQSPYCTY